MGFGGARTRPQGQEESPGEVVEEPADHALGRSRGGLTTKIHLSCEQGQKVLSLLATAGQRGDSARYDKLAVRYEATLRIAVLNDWLTSL